MANETRGLGAGSILCIVGLAAAAGCARPTPRASAAPAVASRLPPGAIVYVQVDARRVLADPNAALLVQALPAGCADMVRALDTVAVAFYEGETSGAVAAAIGPTAEAVEACLTLGAKLPLGPREAGAPFPIAPVTGETPGLLLSPAPDLHLFAYGSAVAAGRAAAGGGGPSLAGDPILGLLGEVPPGMLTVALRVSDAMRTTDLPEELAALPGGAGRALVGGAISLDAGPTLTVRGTVVMADAAGAAGLAGFLQGKLAEAKAAVAQAVQDPSLPMMLRQVPQLLESVRISTDGVRVRAGFSTELGGVESLGILSAVAIPAYLRYVDQAREATAELATAKVASLLEAYAAEFGAAPTTPRVEGLCLEADCNAECVPRRIAQLAGGTYVPTPEEWACSAPGPGCARDTAWSALGYASTEPLDRQFCYTVWNEDGVQQVEIAAFADRDHDGHGRAVRRGGWVQAGRLTLGPAAQDPDED